MDKVALSALMQMPDVQVAWVSFGRYCGFGYGSIFRLMQILRLDMTTQQEAAGGVVMDDGPAAHNIVSG